MVNLRQRWRFKSSGQWSVVRDQIRRVSLDLNEDEGEILFNVLKCICGLDFHLRKGEMI